MPVVRTLILAVFVLLSAVAGEWYVAVVRGETEVSCRVSPQTAQLDALPEASGLALSRRISNTLWSHNDAGKPVLYALDTQGKVRTEVSVTGASVTDWEDVSTARCGGGNCLYIADIGDNDERRASIVVYRVVEPAPGATATARAERLTARYPDGPHDAEALFVTPNGGLFIVTKGKQAATYRFPELLQTDETMTLQPVGLLSIDDVTDAETSADGRWVAVRGRDTLTFYPTDSLEAGFTEQGAMIDLSPAHEPQGEGVAMSANGTVYLAGEGEKKGPGTLTSAACTFPKRD